MNKSRSIDERKSEASGAETAWPNKINMGQKSIASKWNNCYYLTVGDEEPPSPIPTTSN